jgi:hypothetical protein
MMNEQPPVVRKKLRGWFWPLLFAPALFSAVASTLVTLFIKNNDQVGWLLVLNIFAALPMNGVCSAICAVHLSRTRTEDAKPAWLVLGTLGFFALNGALAFGGCTAGVFLSEAIQH